MKMPEKEYVEEDPMELVGMVLPGECGQLERMAECIVEEYVRMGWDEKRLMTIFVHPMFLATHRVYLQKGELYVRELIQDTCNRYRISRTEALAPASQDILETHVTAVSHG
jgi:hypothetical protein